MYWYLGRIVECFEYADIFRTQLHLNGRIDAKRNSFMFSIGFGINHNDTNQAFLLKISKLFKTFIQNATYAFIVDFIRSFQSDIQFHNEFTPLKFEILPKTKRLMPEANSWLNNKERRRRLLFQENYLTKKNK